MQRHAPQSGINTLSDYGFFQTILGSETKTPNHEKFQLRKYEWSIWPVQIKK